MERFVMVTSKKSTAALEQLPALVTFADAQAQLNCGRKTIYSLAKAKKLEMVRIGRLWRITERSLVRLINDQLKQRV